MEVEANPLVHTIHWTFDVGGMEQSQDQFGKRSMFFVIFKN